MLEEVRSTVRASWLAVSLAAVLSISVPAAASMAGVAVATPSPASRMVLVAAPTTHPGAQHTAVRTAVLAAEGARRPEHRVPSHSRWDAASVLVRIPAGGIVARRNPWTSAAALGRVTPASKYYRVPIVLWVEETNAKGTWGRVELPYVWPRVDGWIPLAGLARETTFVHVDVDLSEHRVRVYKHDALLYSVAGATGTWSSPTPPGAYVVTDRVPFPSGGALGTFAFGISGIQPRLPAGWSGGNQLAIHGTNDASSIGTNASAGCVRVSEWALDRFKPLLRLGTPVLIHA
jgi:lipoprotein-anchoring transpeptidase ErfK/SrfK